ncbi:MAG: DNA-directed DNA polymerase [Candidatus ainarchaeum sp.]|nr:DNA-directed DNA polymerase [Candidatus ainarchaeum sp.]
MGKKLKKQYSGTILDVFYENNEKNESIINICINNGKVKQIIEDPYFKPYFYVEAGNEKKFEKALEDNKNLFLSYEKQKKQEKNFIYKLYFKNTTQLMEMRSEIKNLDSFVAKHDYDIPFDQRYIIDKQITPLSHYLITSKEGLEFEEKETDFVPLCCAVDIETTSDNKDMLKNEIISIAIYSEKIKIILSYRDTKENNNDLEVCKDEKEMIERALEILNNFDFIFTYNGDNFDIPVICNRAKEFDIDMGIYLKPKIRKSSMGKISYTAGIQHIDVYKIIAYLARVGSISLNKLDLTTAYETLLEKDKIDIEYTEIPELWENIEKRNRLFEYNLDDSKATYELGEKYLLTFTELSKMIHRTVQDTIRLPTSNMIESIIMYYYAKEKKFIPKKPIGDIVGDREEITYVGGYVKQPEPNIYENIAVIDFRSLHPSIIITHNISPETLNVPGKKCVLSPTKDKFNLEVKAIIPGIIKEILDKRIKVKTEMHKADKNKQDVLFARQWSLKRLLASFYGYLAYPRARWYCLECARSTVAYSQEYIKMVCEQAEKNALKVIYSDTDSAFLIYRKQSEVETFLKKINSTLPGEIKLTLDGYYKRGLFVAKKSENVGAKKRYALIDFEGNLKIVGFEFVRRDWSNVAKSLQKEVLEIILKEGNLEKAIKKIRETIALLVAHKVKKEDLVLSSKITKPLNKYNNISPHVSAARKAERRGVLMKPGTLVNYIITKNGISISERAELEQFVKDNSYDEEYYINNQVLPAVIPLVEQLGFTKEKLIESTKQQRLF